MKLIAQINGESKTVDVKREGEMVFAEVDGCVYELESSNPEKNVYLLKSENRIVEVFVSPEKEGALTASLNGEDYEVSIADPKNLRGGLENAADSDGVVEIKTAMPGKVVRVLKKPGDKVNAGEGLIVVEAMKMQNEMKSQKDGVVKEVRFQEDETVNAGDILVIVE